MEKRLVELLVKNSAFEVCVHVCIANREGRVGDYQG